MKDGRWTIQQPSFPLTDSLMMEVLRDIFELIVSEPANYLKYYIGYLEFHDLQEEMKKQNPDTYTDSAFYEKSIQKFGPGIIQCAAGLCVGEPVTSACRFSRRFIIAKNTGITTAVAAIHAV